MKTVDAGLIAYYSRPGVTRVTCIEIIAPDGAALRGTTYSTNLGPIDGNTYYHASSPNATDVETQAALTVTNAEIVCNFADMTAADIARGRWDGSTALLFLVNPEDLTQGKYRQMAGTIGEITVNRQGFSATLEGVGRKLNLAFGRTVIPGCVYIVGDEDCRVDLGDAGDSPPGFTVAGTLDSVSADQMTLRDAARAEPGPGGGIAISAITLADPPVITLATAITQQNGEAITFSDITTPARLNGTWVIQSRSTDGLSFSIATDTSDDAAYTGSGIATPYGSDPGYFGYGRIIISSVTREIKAYVPGQFVLHEPFPFVLVGNEAYEAIAGCDGMFVTCREKFENQLNFGGFPYVPGQDSALQVARSD